MRHNKVVECSAAIERNNFPSNLRLPSLSASMKHLKPHRVAPIGFANNLKSRMTVLSAKIQDKYIFADSTFLRGTIFDFPQ